MCTASTSAVLATHSANMASGGGSVATLWSEVSRCGQNGDYTRALKALTKSRNSYLSSLPSIGPELRIDSLFLTAAVS